VPAGPSSLIVVWNLVSGFIKGLLGQESLSFSTSTAIITYGRSRGRFLVYPDIVTDRKELEPDFGDVNLPWGSKAEGPGVIVKKITVLTINRRQANMTKARAWDRGGSRGGLSAARGASLFFFGSASPKISFNSSLTGFFAIGTLRPKGHDS